MHRRGGAGIAALNRQTQSQQSFAALSSTISQAQIQTLESQLAQFRTALQTFASEHRDDIRKDPVFRNAFQQMCKAIGVDPLAGPGPRRGGWWTEILGGWLGEWTFELGVQVVDVCVSTRDRNGGMIEMEEMLRLVRKLRGVREEVTEEDIVRAIKTLEPLGAGYEVIEIGGSNGRGGGGPPRRMIRSVPRALDSDQTDLLALAYDLGGRLDEAQVVERLGWTHERARGALENMLLRDGLCWVDDVDDSFWVPSVLGEEELE